MGIPKNPADWLGQTGACGLNHTARNHWRQQTNFWWWIKLAVPGQAMGVMVGKEVAQVHKVHLFSCVGTYRRWVAKYPNTLFGVSRATFRAGGNFLCLADLKKLVLESDAPYKVREDRGNCPCGLAVLPQLMVFWCAWSIRWPAWSPLCSTMTVIQDVVRHPNLYTLCIKLLSKWFFCQYLNQYIRWSCFTGINKLLT